MGIIAAIDIETKRANKSLTCEENMRQLIRSNE